MQLSDGGIQQIIDNGKTLGMSEDAINEAIQAAAEGVKEGRLEKYAVECAFPVTAVYAPDLRTSAFRYWLDDQDTRVKNSNSTDGLAAAWDGATATAIEIVRALLRAEHSPIDNQAASVIQTALRKMLTNNGEA